MRSTEKKPCAARTRPEPWQVAQVLGCVPGLAPEPEQTSQVIEVGTLICAVLPAEGFFQCDFHIVAKVGAALASAGRPARTAAAHHLAEDVFENIGETAIGETAAAHATATHAAIFKGGVAETVIGRALLRVLQRFVCFVDFFEFPFGIGIIRVFVRMEFHREFAEGAFQLFFVRGLADAKCFVKVCFRH